MTNILLTLIGGVGGSGLTILYSHLRNSIQKMHCYYIDDDVLSKIPQKHNDDTVHQNIHCKKFKIKNTTNMDVKEFKVVFHFDKTSKILDCYSRSKEGINEQKITINKQFNNAATAIIRYFNRGDEIEYVFNIADISNNEYYVRESECNGFKIVCKDKRRDAAKSKSKQSDQILIE